MSEKENLKKTKASIQTVLKTEQGKDFVWEILSLCGIYDNQFTGNSGTFFNEGRRSVGIDIIQTMLNEADPTIYPRLLLERARLEDNNNE